MCLDTSATRTEHAVNQMDADQSVPTVHIYHTSSLQEPTILYSDLFSRTIARSFILS